MKGSHGTVTACTLPMWLPTHIIDIMVADFGTQLRNELVNLMSLTGQWRKRSASTGSGGRGSPDIFRGPPGGIAVRGHAAKTKSHFPADEEDDSETPQL